MKNTEQQEQHKYLIGIFASLIPPFSIALMLWGFLGWKVALISFLIGSFHTVALFCFLRTEKGKNVIESGERSAEKILDNSNEYAKRCYLNVKMNYTCRHFAAMRLVQDESWIQNISIFYSVFTALLAVLSLKKSVSDDLALPSVLFTVAVAILVTFANAQKCGARAADLFSNCRDLKQRLVEVTEIVSEWKEGISGDEKESKAKRLRECMKEYTDNLGDSEEHSLVDEWKYCNSWLFYIYLTLKILFFYILILIPFLFLLCNRKIFLNALCM